MGKTHTQVRPSGSAQAAGQVSSSPKPMIEARRIRVERAGRLLLEVPDLAIRKGETLAVIGPNGAGKSTLIRVLGMLEQPTSGRVSFDDQVVLDPSPAVDLVSLRRKTAVSSKNHC